MNWRNRIIERKRMRVGDLAVNERNPKIHPSHQHQRMEAVLEKFGVVTELVAYYNGDGKLALFDGHLRQKLDPKQEWDIAITDLTQAEVDELVFYYDPLTAMIEQDAAMMTALMADLQDVDGVLGKMLEEMAEDAGAVFRDEVPEAPEAQIDKAAELQERWGVKIGDVWQAGEHLIICGDCREPEVWARLLAAAKIEKVNGAVVTDPPYGIERDGIVNDDPEGLRALFDSVLAAMPMESAIVIAFQSPRLFPVWLDATRAAGHKFERMLWMYKPNDETYPWRGWLQTSEAILVSSVGKPKWVRVNPFAHDCYSPTTLGSELPREWGRAHPTVKPLVVVSDLIARVGGDIFDPFLGSGTTIVAAHQNNRRGLGIEALPKYVSVGLQRLSDMGLEPRLQER